MSKKLRWAVVSILAGVIVVAGTAVVYAAAGGNENGVAAGIAGSQGVAATCNGKQTKQAYVNHADQNGTTSTTHVDIPGATVPFAVSSRGGRKCVSVVFTSMAWAPGGLVYVRALLDGTPGDPVETQFEADSGAFAISHAMTFVFNAVAPGPHTIQMQFRSNSSSQTVFLHRGTTLVLFA